jgi:uncharacterized protein (TIGR02646 family)
MKCVRKGIEPQSLRHYRNCVPHGTWQEMRVDALFGGQQAYVDCRDTVIADQGGICAFCEIDIRDIDPNKCHVEHFHPKSDTTSTRNWALDWPNLFGVCQGGSNAYVDAPGHFLSPRKENLSCDQYKDQMIQAGKLPQACDGWILNPLHLPDSPALFRLEMSSGRLIANLDCCQLVTIQGNQHATTAMLVEHSINMLNLNCDRLCQSRLRIIRDIERAKKCQRESGYNATDGLANLVVRYFRTRWPGFFTTIRLCLGSAAESHLQSVGYRG